MYMWSFPDICRLNGEGSLPPRSVSHFGLPFLCSPPLIGINCLALLREALSSAELAIRPRANLLRLAPVIIPLVQIAALPITLARVDNRAGISVVGVNTTQDAAVNGNGSLDVDVARPAVSVAVTAAADQLAVVLGVEVGDDDVATAVELENLVRCREGAAAVDVRGAGLLLEGGGVLADILPPDVVEGAGVGVSRVLGRWGEERAGEAHQVPRQWIPSAWPGPRMTLEMVAPSSRTNMASSSPVSDCSWQVGAIVRAWSANWIGTSIPGSRMRPPQGGDLTIAVETLHLAIELAGDGDGLCRERLAGGLGDGGGDLSKGRGAEANGKQSGSGLHFDWTFGGKQSLVVKES